MGSAAAPLGVETILYFQSLDIMICEFFGSTETCGPQTCCGEGTSTKKFFLYTSIWISDWLGAQNQSKKQIEQDFSWFFTNFLT